MHDKSQGWVMIIKQQIFNSNGFYNFTLDFFENLKFIITMKLIFQD